MNTRDDFFQKMTSITKGGAIICLVIHHSIGYNPGLPVAGDMMNASMLLATRVSFA